MTRLIGTSGLLSTIRRLHWLFSTTAELRSEVAGIRIRTWHLMPTDRMGPPPGASPPMRMTASWSGSNQILPHTSLRHEDAPHGELPSDPQQTDGRPPGKPPFAVHHRAACSGAKALRNTSVARRQAAKLLPFRSLDPFRALRAPDRRRRDEERVPAPNTEPAKTKKRVLDRKSPIQVLDRKSPIQVRIHLPPAPSLVRT